MIPSSGNCGLLLNQKLNVRKKKKKREKNHSSLFPQGIYPVVGLLGHMVV